jgi:hypothetical protein
VVVEVVAGLVPEIPEPEFTRRWALTSRQWNDAEDKSGTLAELAGRANGYATLLMVQPDRVNWVRLDWIWL